MASEPTGRDRLQGDFEELFEQFCDSIHYFFVRRGFTHEEASDLTQETFFRVYLGIGGFRKESKPSTWIMRIAANVYKNEIRSRRTLKRDHISVSIDEPTSPQSTTSPLETLAQPPTVEIDPELRLRDKQRRAKLLGAISQLPPKQRQCLLLRSKGHEYSTIAELLGITVGTVKSHLHQARASLLKVLTDPVDESPHDSPRSPHE